ncbi:tRNA (N(6)-L-threonylcarbamoyladenosine(37)-C(2))-methylthiotransferase MtaB [Aquabacter sp. P-9]|uniref:tRNA (N(6)-L-threonylcarbamoyladenosine(37)-C(2))- methylthiotransferase MtaB n=1 Tax=Aquabacter sediminis TaxID=3029197 RepID=UPI00237E2464|nr:tRNA (N(6)-L-threonylcarbamoyladenosine(37)-C(2))-methylthiotransferase MtaB [Aquabacter sp. P-9]MDE1568074.1 tRNA (N(6)-L-threonylcarbamoyladenosine(37)-C(2))-methylthiotransferase MtaB [Aquabacter sp. P-9]
MTVPGAAPEAAREDGISILTFGCRLNALDSTQMEAAARAAGVTDAVIVNTCAVTAEAVNQARQAIRKAKRERPSARIIVAGCAAQADPSRFIAMPEVDRVIGNVRKTDPGLWRETRAALAVPTPSRLAVDDIMAVRAIAPHMADGLDRRTRAFVQVQDGCDHRCTFCIIPFGRGNARSVPMGAVVAHIARVVEAGQREVVLTGVDLTSYGCDLPGTPTLGRLVRSILRHVPALERLRLSSIDMVEADDELLTALAEEERLMPHLHLSLQSGDDLILKRMKRRHSRADAERLVAEMRRRRPDLVLGADLIAGFPTETEAQFRNTLTCVDGLGLSFLHVFPFSPRPGTPAARMPQIARPLVKERARRLREKGEAALLRHLAAQVGRSRAVLVEADGGGRTPHFTPVRVARAARPGAILDLRISGHDGARLIAA